MRLGTRLDPRAKERLRRVSSSGGNEFVSRLTEGPVRTESDRPKADAEPLVLDDLVGAAVLGGGVGVGSGSTNLTRQGSQPLREDRKRRGRERKTSASIGYRQGWGAWGEELADTGSFFCQPLTW